MKDGIRRHSSLICCAEYLLIPLLEFWAFRNASIVARPRQMVFLKFYPSAWLQVVPCFIYQLYPILDTYCDSSRVNVVELAVEIPGRSKIADQKLHIGRHNTGLYRRKIHADYATGRVYSGEVQGPSTGATADVQNIA